MESNTINQGIVTPLTVESDRGARVFTWSVWLIMLFTDLFILIKSGRIFPLNEDWWLVPPLTGNEPNLVNWFLTQNSEHFIPFPRLILLTLLKAANGDLRIGMLFNIIVLGAVAFALIWVARKIRGGRTSLADAIFPIILLHLGNVENLFWAWQLTQVIPTILTCIILLVLVGSQTLMTPRAAVVGGITLMLLPISGSHALLFAPTLALWFGFCGVVQWRAAATDERRRWIGGFLVGSALVALGFTGLFLINYERPSWRPPDPTVSAALETAVKFLTLSFGPAVRSLWTPYVLAIIILLAGSTVVTMSAVLRRKDSERYRAFGVLLFLGNIVLLALVTGWGRATAIETVYGQYPLRYVTMAAPALLAVFFVWVLYGPGWLRTTVQGGLLVVMCLLIPANTLQGLNWHYWFPDRDRSLQQDLQAGMSASDLAERYQGLLLHFREPAEIARYMRMLRDAGIGPFAQLAADPDEPIASIQPIASTQVQPESPTQFVASDPKHRLVSRTIRYSMAEAAEVYLVWGMAGWQVAPGELQPAGTDVIDHVMHTPMVRDGDVFFTEIRVPADTTIDYGFLITEKRGLFDIVQPTWDWGIEGYQTIVLEPGITEVQASLGLSGYLFSMDLGRYLLSAVGLMFGIAVVITGIQRGAYNYLAYYRPKASNEGGRFHSFSSYWKRKFLDFSTVAVSALRSDRAARAFVWSVWLAMVLAAFFILFKYARNVPFSEDWLLVPPLTGNEPDLFGWLWAQNNEHRIPFPRLILLGLLKISHGDFRAGMLFNIIILGTLAFAMIRVVRHIRGGQTHYVDAFFPIALLHLGNWENFFWSWQITQVIPVVLTCIILLALAGSRSLTPLGAVASGISLILLPLNGANGLIFVPILALWLGYWGLRNWRDETLPEGKRRLGGFLIGSVGVALTLVGLYFVGYKPPLSDVPNPSPGAALRATVQFLALGFGPVARSSWMLSTTAIIIVLLFSAVIGVLAVVRHKGLERFRALGILVFFGSVGVFALAMGWGRAEVLKLPVWGGIWPTRYSLFAVPALITVFFVWELYGPARLRTAAQSLLFVSMFLLIPFNTIHGFWWYYWYLQGAEPFEQDVRAGMSPAVVGERNQGFLFHWMDSNFDRLRMLHEAHMGPFTHLAETSNILEASSQNVTLTKAESQFVTNIADNPLVTQTFRYDMPEAGEVYLVWGVNGWHVAPEELRPFGTEVKYDVMHTSMVQKGDTFMASVAVPAGSTIDYCFLITKKRHAFDITWPLCDGEYQQIASDNDIKEIKTTQTLALVSQEIRYFVPGADKVYLLWGLNGWHAAPEDLWPVGTELKNNILYTPMVQTGDTFVTKVWVPARTAIDYGFQITERRGLFDIVYPVWDGNYQEIPVENNTKEVKVAVSLAKELSDMFDRRQYFLAGGVILLGTWVIIFFLLGFLKR